MRSRLRVLTCFNAHFWTFNPTIRNSSVALQVCEEATHLFMLMVVYSDTLRKYMSHMPHPLCAKADGRMVYTVPVIIFMDDASANILKQWNKHIVVYLSNVGLPREMLDKEFCTKFIMSSLNAPPIELMHAVRDSMEYVWIYILSIHHVSLYLSKALDTPVVTFDCKTRKEISIIPYLIFTVSDNPMHAKQISQSGLRVGFREG